MLEHPVVRHSLAEATSLLGSARSWFYEVAAEAWEVVVGGGELNAGLAARVRLASVNAVRSSARAADMVFEMARTAPVRDGDELGRAWRDVHVVRQHAALSPIGLGEAGFRFTPGRG
jgi:alkylation response protein AidB-like acyl-CoA dehydrogenase